VTDPLAGKYTRKNHFGAEFEKAKTRLAPLGGVVRPGVHDYEAFIYEGPGVRLIFYPHRTSANNYHIRVRTGGKCEPKALRAAIFALAENSCTFQFPADRRLHDEAVRAALDREHRALEQAARKDHP
jgi:hypothetical protein